MAESDQRRPPTHVTGTRQAPDVTATVPNARHGVTTFTASSWNRKRNSLLEPWVDVRANLDAINAGEGVYDPATRRIWVNGRLYGMHENGTTFPIEGDGIIPLNRGTYRALQAYQEYNGINERSIHALRREKGVTDEDRATAQRIWRMREEARGHDPDDRH